MKLETKRLVLREYVESDWEAVHLYASIPGFSRFEEWGPNTVADTRDFIARAMENNSGNPRLKYEFAVILKSEDRLIGAVDLRMEEPDSREAKIGLTINPDFQNQGYATEAAIALIDFGFNSLSLETIKASCDSENHASRKVMQKAQMTQTAFNENDKQLRGEMRSSYEFEIQKP